MALGACKRLAFESLGVVLLMRRHVCCNRAMPLSPVFPSSLKYQDQRARVGMSRESP
jgi:hypothetical protein